jgi:hypothetical protein
MSGALSLPSGCCSSFGSGGDGARTGRGSVLLSPATAGRAVRITTGYQLRGPEGAQRPWASSAATAESDREGLRDLIPDLND